MLGVLPAETLLEILTFLPITDLHAVQLTCKDWARLVRVNDEFLYRAYLRRTKPGCEKATDLQQTKGKHALDWLDGVGSWKDLGKRYYQLYQAWTGKAEAIVKVLPRSSNMVHRFKVDEIERTLISSNSTGGLSIADIATDEIIWTLPRQYVDAYAHVEYDSTHGYLAFNRSSHDIDLWQRSLSPAHPHARPTDIQSMLSPPSTPPARGKLSPIAALHHPAQTRAFRLVYPTLLVASQEAGTCYVWDLPSLTCQEITVGPGWTGWAQQWIYYVEVSPLHVFVCSDTQVKIFSRATSELVLSFPPPDSVFESSPARQALVAWSLERNPRSVDFADTGRGVGSVVDRPGRVMLPCELVPPTHTLDEAREAVLTADDPQTTLLDQEAFANAGGVFAFSAVHVSPDGRDFIAVHTKEYLYWVHDFARGAEGVEGRTEVLRFEGASIANLAWDGQRALVTTSKGVYVLTTPRPSDPEPGDEGEAGRTAPFQLYVVAPFADRYALTHLSSAQLTETGVWLTWHPGMRRFQLSADGMHIEANNVRNAPLVHYVDFTYSGRS